MKIATFNVNSVRMRLAAVTTWLAQHQPDVLCLQETKVQDSEFPEATLKETGYHIAYRGMKGYNGVAVFSKHPFDEVSFGLDNGGPPDEERLARVVVRGIPIINTYVPQGFEIDSPKYAYKLEWFKRLKVYFKKHLSPDRPAIWLGDLNVAPEPIDVHAPEKHLKHVCFHEDARKAYKDTVAWGFVDTFRALYPDRQQFTFWDYLRPDNVEKNKGWRIDHILVTRPLVTKCKEVAVDIEPRRAPKASDHTVVWAEFSGI
jgi:exodeoxyribonuclease-3